MSDYEGDFIEGYTATSPCEYCGCEQEECGRASNQAAEQFRRVFGAKLQVLNPTMDCTVVALELGERKLGLYQVHRAMRGLAFFADGAATTQDGRLIALYALEVVGAFLRSE